MPDKDPYQKVGEIIGVTLVGLVFYALIVLFIKLTQWLF